MANKKKHMKVISATAVLGAALGMATSASAQTNVTVFGQVSLSLTKASGSSTALNTTGFGSGIGFKGSEDLGGGLSAFFHLENRFDADTGAVGSSFWAEKSVVGLSGNFGLVQFGRFANAYDAVNGIGDPFGETVANMAHENALGETKWNNAVGYYSPDFGGFSFAVNAATNESSTTDAAPATHSPFAFNLKYANGPATVGLGYVKNAANDVKSTSLSGNYDFGPAKLFAGYTRSTNTGAGNARNMQIGVAVPVSAVGVVKAAYGNYKANTDLSDRENKVGLGYWHTMSKRTLLFADVARTSARVAGATNDTNAFDVGIFHKF